MTLSNNLLADFAKTLSEPKTANAKRSVETTVYATVVSTSGTNAVIQIDGSDAQTPAVMVTDCRAGDRVTVKIKNHRATITGNITAPASARADDRYMRFTSEGLMIGRLDVSGNPTGYYILIQDDAYLVKNASGVTVARYAGNEITMYDTGGNVIGKFTPTETSLNGGAGRVVVDSNVLYLLAAAVGMRSEYQLPNSNTYRGEVAVKVNSFNPQVAMQFLVNNVRRSAVLIDDDGAYVVSPTGLYINDYEALTARNFAYYGIARVCSTIEANSVKNFDATITVPSGYVLAGFKSVAVFRDNATHDSALRVTNLTVAESAFNTSNNSVRAWVTNTGSATENAAVRFEWVAYKIQGRSIDTPEVIVI